MMMGVHHGRVEAFILLLALQLACSIWLLAPAATALSLRQLRSGHDAHSHGAESAHVCGPSSLGYQCYRQVCKDIALHWTLGGDAPSDLSLCSYPPYAANSSGASDADAEIVHFALVTDYGGYVAMAFAEKQHEMAPADSVIGTLDPFSDELSVHPYAIHGWSVKDVQPEAFVALSNLGGNAGSKGKLTVCFSRPVAAVGAAGINLQAGISNAAGVVMNFAASGSPGLAQHSMDKGHLCSVRVSLLARSMQGGGHIEEHTHDYSASVDTHGIMMLSAWLLLAPFGVVAARYKWTMHSSGGPGTWFQVHRTVQVLAGLVFLVGFILPFVGFGHHGQHEHTGAVEAHGIIGITIATVTALHLVGTLFRPKPHSSNRWIFNMLHRWLGRGLLGLAVANIFVGVQVYHVAFECTRLKWYLPISIIVLGWMIAFVMLERMHNSGESITALSVPTHDMDPWDDPSLPDGAVYSSGSRELLVQHRHHDSNEGWKLHRKSREEEGGYTEMTSMNADSGRVGNSSAPAHHSDSHRS